MARIELRTLPEQFATRFISVERRWRVVAISRTVFADLAMVRGLQLIEHLADGGNPIRGRVRPRPRAQSPRNAI
jgi:hypothetical protein